MTTTGAETPQQKQEKAPSPRCSKLFKCEHHLCPGLGICTDKDCSMCGVNLHSLCVAEAFQEALAADPDADEGFTICSVSCLRFSKIEGLTVDVIKAE